MPSRIDAGEQVLPWCIHFYLNYKSQNFLLWEFRLRDRHLNYARLGRRAGWKTSRPRTGQAYVQFSVEKGSCSWRLLGTPKKHWD